MSIMQLGALGEFVGAVAVVLTLGYLAVQVRLASKSTRSNAVAQAASDHIATMRSLAENPALASAFEKALRGDVLEPPESTQFGFWFACLLRGAETHVQMASLGIVPEFEEPTKELLRAFSKNDGVMRGMMQNYIGTKMFKKWLTEKVLT